MGAIDRAKGCIEVWGEFRLPPPTSEMMECFADLIAECERLEVMNDLPRLNADEFESTRLLQERITELEAELAECKAELLNYQSIALQEGADKAVDVIRQQTARECAEIASHMAYMQQTGSEFTGGKRAAFMDLAAAIKAKYGIGD